MEGIDCEVDAFFVQSKLSREKIFSEILLLYGYEMERKWSKFG